MIDSSPYHRPASYFVSLVHELRALPSETEWVEFKVNDAEPQTIGSYISGLANTAALVGKAFAYLVWGVRDEDHAKSGAAVSTRSFLKRRFSSCRRRCLSDQKDLPESSCSLTSP